MTVLDDLDADIDEPHLEDELDHVELLPDAATEARVRLQDVSRPLLASGLAAAGTALVIGGIFGSWTARLLGVIAVAVGTIWVFVAKRSSNPVVGQVLLYPVLAVTGFLSLVGTSGGGPNELPRLMGDAIASGRLFRPPVPFDAGWRPLLVLLLGMLAFGVGSLAVAGRAKLTVGITLPLTVLALISQPDNSAFLGGVLAFLPLLAGLAVVFGEDGTRAGGGLTRDFEAKRAGRAAVGALVVVAVLFGLSRATFLFPQPVYNPDDKPQKPRAVPLSASKNRVLFTVVTDSGLTGPWRIGALDVYDDDAFQSVASTSRLEPLPGGTQLSDLRTGDTQQLVTITIADIGDQAVLPTLAGTTTVELRSGLTIRRDPRYGTVRVPTGRVPRGTVYELRLPKYPTGDQLSSARPGSKSEFGDQLDVPSPPAVVRDLLASAPANAWKRLDLLRQTLLDRVVASGAGTPTEVTADRVGQIMAPRAPSANGKGGNKATPYEIVATEALLARWAGVPSRVGFGFDGLNLEKGKLTVRPRNSAQWLEVYFDHYGWVPLIGQPNQAEANLDDPNQKFTPSVLPSDDVAGQVYVLYEQRDIKLLYQKIRDLLIIYGPWLIVGLLAYAAYPAVAKLLRSRRRRVWAAERGPLAQIMVEYAEMRDLAIDLNIGDDYDTPLEYLAKVEYDEEHEELAWLATQALYDDLVDRLGQDDVRAAEELGASIRRRLRKAQPFQSQVLGLIGRGSIEVPYTAELPNVRVVRIGPIVVRYWSVVWRPVARLARSIGARGRRVVTWPAATVRRRFRPAGGELA